MTNEFKELLKYVPNTKELANEDTFTLYKEMTTELEDLQAEFGKELDILNDIMIVSGDRFLVEAEDMTAEEAEEYGLVYTIDGEWDYNTAVDHMKAIEKLI